MHLNKHALSLEFDKVLKKLATCAATPLGAERCLGVQIYFGKREIIEREIELTACARKILDDLGAQTFSQLDFIADCKSALNARKLSAQEIFDCARMLCCARNVKNALKNTELSNFRDILYANIELEERIFNTFDSNLNVAEDASEALKSLYNSRRDSEANLKKKIGELLSSADFVNCLQDTLWTKRQERVVFQVKAPFKNKVGGIVHDTSSSGQTFFIEPRELVPLNNKLRELEVQILVEVERILLALSGELSALKTELISTQKTLVELDFTFAKARYSILVQGVAPRLTPKLHKHRSIKIQKMRHPLLIGAVDKLIENDFEIGEANESDFNSLIITGSNTGGKTVVLKTVGLLALMTFAGLFVPALDCEIYPFSAVFADISEEQSLAQSLSTFSAHIKNVVNILNEADENSLVLFDELGAGTDPSEGTALAQAILEHLSDLGAITLTTTHLGELKLLQYNNPKFKNASVEFDPETLKPTYKLILGIAGSSNALLISRNLNLKNEIVTRAQDILNSTLNPTSQMFEQIQKTHQSLSQLEFEASIKEQSAAQIKEEYEKQLAQIKAEKKKAIENFKRKYQSGLEIARSEIKETLDELRVEKSEKIARRSYARLAKLETAARAEFQTDEEKLANKYPPLMPDEIEVGKSVLVKGLGAVATLLSLPDKKGQVEIQMGGIKSKINILKLAHTDKKAPKPSAKHNVEFDFAPDPTANLLRLDLRGLRADEALDTLEKHLDLASLKGVNEVTVIHGHGTGALKTAVRDYLKVSPYVAKFRAGEMSGEGGDGVSVVTMR